MSAPTASHVTFVRAAHPDPTDTLLTAYNVYVKRDLIGQVWQVRTVTFGRPETTGHKRIHHVDWARTGTDEVTSTRREAAASLHATHQTASD